MPDSPPTTDLRVLVFAYNASGEADVCFLKIRCTRDQCQEAAHVGVAMNIAADRGYSRSDMIITDETDMLGHGLLDKFEWGSASTYDLRGNAISPPPHERSDPRGSHPGFFFAEYDQEIPDYGDVMTKEEWLEDCECGGFIDYDGHGRLIKDGKCCSQVIAPSTRHLWPTEATHIVWFNR